MATRRRTSPRLRRGFTMVELLAVVAMIGILAAIAVVGYQKYFRASFIGEAKDVVGAIRTAQTLYKSETLGYLNCSGTVTNWYPAAPDGKPRHFNDPGHANYDCWKQLNVVTDAPTRFGYSVVAGAPGQQVPAPSTLQKPQWPTTTEPWFIVQAAGDQNKNGVFSYVLSSSFSGELYVENEYE
ncbi:MAG: prepilin-type N-terminal cleavage/methylation domain-containing protein [Myxococcales bacterium]|nr:prepilin-type N-terminal cleavage/methylation domain-containing protein [Myxococcales bacterium]